MSGMWALSSMCSSAFRTLMKRQYPVLVSDHPIMALNLQAMDFITFDFGGLIHDMVHPS